MKKSATRWDASTYKSEWHEVVYLLSDKNFIINIVKKINLPKDASILEIGIGSGKWSAAFAIMGFNVTGIDSNSEILKQFNRNFPNIHINLVHDELPNLKSVASKKKYDLIFNEGVIEHFIDKKERINAIRSMGDCCVPGGYVYFLVPFLSDKEDEHRYTSLNEIRDEVAAAGLKPLLFNIMGLQVVDPKQDRWHSFLSALGKKI